MSDIYITEPQTSGKVLLHTNFGDVDIELWSKEAPLACRNFIQLALEGYYDNTIFHRVIRGFMIQGGDPTGTGEGGESIYGKPFRDEIHQRIRFNHRGQVAMANSETRDSNQSQFFITLDSCDWLKGKHTIFGKVTGNTVFNVLRAGEALTDAQDRPLEELRLTGVEVLWNPFDDIVPREIKKQQGSLSKEEQEQKEIKEKRKKRKGKKDTKLLSFGEEAEEEEATAANFGKIASSHDKLNDDKLSKETAYDKDSLDYKEGERRKEKSKEKEAAKQKLKEAVREKDKVKEGEEDKEKEEEDALNFDKPPQEKGKKEELPKKRTKVPEEKENETFDERMRRQALERKRRLEDQAAARAREEREGGEDGLDLDSYRRAEERRKIKEKTREAAVLREQLREQHRALHVLTGEDRQKLEEETAYREMLTPLEQRRQKYLKRKRDHGARQTETLEKLKAFTSKVRTTKKEAKPKEDEKEEEPESYHGQVTEKNDDEDDAGNDKDWFVGKLKFKKHIDDAFRGGDGRDLNDYVVLDPLQKGKGGGGGGGGAGAAGDDGRARRGDARKRTTEWSSSGTGGPGGQDRGGGGGGSRGGGGGSTKISNTWGR